MCFFLLSSRVSVIAACQVHPGQVLFVPSGAAVSWHATVRDANGVHRSASHVAGTSAAAAVAVVLEHCYFDSSNVNRVKSELMTSSLVDDAEAALLQVLQSPQLDVSVDRKPQVRVWWWCARRRTLRP